MGRLEHSFTTKNSALGVGTIADVPLPARVLMLWRGNAHLSIPGDPSSAFSHMRYLPNSAWSPSVARLAQSVRC